MYCQSRESKHTMGHEQTDDFGNRKDERRGLRVATKSGGRLLAEGCSDPFEHCAGTRPNRGGNGLKGEQEEVTPPVRSAAASVCLVGKRSISLRKPILLERGFSLLACPGSERSTASSRAATQARSEQVSPSSVPRIYCGNPCCRTSYLRLFFP